MAFVLDSLRLKGSFMKTEGRMCYYPSIDPPELDLVSLWGLCAMIKINL